KGEEVDIQIIAFNAGLHMLRDDTSPVKPRLKSFKQGMPNVAFMACKKQPERAIYARRDHARGDDTQRGQGAAARRKCRARQGGRRHPDRARRKGLDDHPPLSATKFLARSGGRPEAAQEEATRPAPEPAEPHGPRRCGGPEHSAGCPNLLAIRRETHVQRRTGKPASPAYQPSRYDAGIPRITARRRLWITRVAVSGMKALVRRRPENDEWSRWISRTRSALTNRPRTRLRECALRRPSWQTPSRRRRELV